MSSIINDTPLISATATFFEHYTKDQLNNQLQNKINKPYHLNLTPEIYSKLNCTKKMLIIL